MAKVLTDEFAVVERPAKSRSRQSSEIRNALVSTLKTEQAISIPLNQGRATQTIRSWVAQVALRTNNGRCKGRTYLVADRTALLAWLEEKS